MATFLSKLNVWPTNVRFPGMAPPILEATLEPRGQTFIPIAMEYQLEVVVGVRFKAVDGRYDEALYLARRHLVQLVYGQVFDALHEIRRAACGGDGRAVLEACDKLEKELEQ